MSDDSGYGLWSLVIVNSVIFILFAYTFFKPRTGRDWRSFGAFSAWRTGGASVARSIGIDACLSTFVIATSV